MTSWKERSTSFNSKSSLQDDGSPPPSMILEFKVVMVGTVSVGKTSIASRYVKDSYRDVTNSTFGAAYSWRKERLEDKEIKISLWDTAGMEQFHALVPMYFRETNAVLLVVDAMRDGSDDEALMWLERIKQNAPSEAQIFLVVNKIDVEPELRPYTLARAAALAAQCNEKNGSNWPMEAVEVSAKTGLGVHELFVRVCRKCLEQRLKNAKGGSGAGGKRVEIGNEDASQRRKKDSGEKKGCKSC